MPFKDRNDRLVWYKATGQASKTAERQRSIKREKRKYIQQCKDVPCMDCSIKFHYVCMDFDHRNPAEKLFTIAHAIDNNVSWKNLYAEIAKCDVVCSNCHRIRTHKRNLGI